VHSFNLCVPERSHDLLAVLACDREGYGATPICKALPIVHDAANDRPSPNSLGQFRVLEVATNPLDVREVWQDLLWHRKNTGLDNVAKRDEVRRRRYDHDVVVLL
jgi:hypothetical protein